MYERIQQPQVEKLPSRTGPYHQPATNGHQHMMVNVQEAHVTIFFSEYEKYLQIFTIIFFRDSWCQSHRVHVIGYLQVNVIAAVTSKKCGNFRTSTVQRKAFDVIKVMQIFDRLCTLKIIHRVLEKPKRTSPYLAENEKITDDLQQIVNQDDVLEVIRLPVLHELPSSVIDKINVQTRNHCNWHWWFEEERPGMSVIWWNTLENF